MDRTIENLLIGLAVAVVICSVTLLISQLRKIKRDKFVAGRPMWGPLTDDEAYILLSSVALQLSMDETKDKAEVLTCYYERVKRLSVKNIPLTDSGFPNFLHRVSQ